ncbi:winged helix DNA-binding domain-containing protein [Actinotalea sp. AC32]|nr:winged helix DNA-binding domain-containing protein [Actinotalea sp. AC32]
MTTPHDIALLRLAAQRLAGPRAGTPADAVRHLLAVQGQDLPGALVSIALRTAEPSRDAVVAAFDAGEVVRTWPMRGTLHVVAAEDVAWTVALMCSRPLAAAASRRHQIGLTEAHVATAEDVARTALAGGGLTRAELLAVWADAGIPTAGGPGYHLIAYLAQSGVVCQGPFRGREQLIVLVDEWAPGPRRLDEDEALAELALRYVVGHGPATDKDLARWSGLPLGTVRRGLAAAHEGAGTHGGGSAHAGAGTHDGAGSHAGAAGRGARPPAEPAHGDARPLRTDPLTTLEVDGVTYHLAADLPGLLTDHRDEARRTMLLPGFDEIVLGFADRSATVPPEFADRIVPGGNGVFRPTVVHDGVAVGTWRRVGAGARRRVEVEPFGDLPPGVASDVEELAPTLV